MRSILSQGDICNALEEFHKRIDTCIGSYQVRWFLATPMSCFPDPAISQVRLSREMVQIQLEHHEAVRRDNVELRERVEELISRQMAQAQLEQHEASRRDNIELREKTDDVVTALIHHFNDSGSLPFNSTFQTVVRDIQDVRIQMDHPFLQVQCVNTCDRKFLKSKLLPPSTPTLRV